MTHNSAEWTVIISFPLNLALYLPFLVDLLRIRFILNPFVTPIRCHDPCDEWTSGGDTRRPRDPTSNSSPFFGFFGSFSAGSGRKKITKQLFGVGGWMGQRMREERSLRCSISFHPPSRHEKAGVNQVNRARV